MIRFITIVLFVAVTLTGCISRRSDINIDVKPSDSTGQVAQKSLDESNSRYVTEPTADFSLRLPDGLTLTKDLDEGDAKLFSVINIEGNEQVKYLFIESTANSVAVAADLLATVDGVTVLRREPVTRGGYSGTKVTALLESRNEEVPYYFLSAGGRTYIFSLPSGQPWEYHEAVVDSFKLNS